MSEPIENIEQLKPCPFCGSTNITPGSMSDGDWFVCRDCESAGPFIRSGHPEDWNIRPVEDALRAELAAAKAEYETSALENVQMCEQLRAELAHIREVKDQYYESTVNIMVAMRAELAQARQRIAEPEGEQRWIPVGERMPDEGQQVIIFDGDTVAIATFQDGWWWETPDYTADNVTHWRPLPAQPGEVSE